MTTIVILSSLALHILGAVILLKHRRNVAHHRASIPVIGSHRKLTDELHKRLIERQPVTDWLNPHVLRAKCAAWLRRSGAR